MDLVEKNSLTLDSREVAEMIEKRHADLLRNVRTYEDYLIESKIALVDFFKKSSYLDVKGEVRPSYQITKKGCEFIAHKLTGQKGAEFTATYINKFHEMEDQIENQKYSYMLNDPIKRAKKWIKEQEEKQALLAKVKKDKPKVLFADAVSVSKTSILVGELAKILKQNQINTGQNRLFAWLRNNGYLIKRKGTDYNMPTQRSMELGLFTIKETSITHSDGHISINKTPKVTGKGQVYFINRFKELGFNEIN